MIPLETLMIFGTILSPIWAYFLSKLKSDNWHLYFYACLNLLILTTNLALFPILMPKVTFWLTYYCLFAIIYLLFYGYKYKYKQFFFVSALAIYSLFVAGDLWEIPVFIYDYFFNHAMQPDQSWTWSHIRRLYTIAVFYLLVKEAKLKISLGNIPFLIIGSMWGFVLLLPPLTLFPEQSTLVRVLMLSCFGAFIYRGLK